MALMDCDGVADLFLTGQNHPLTPLRQDFGEVLCRDRGEVHMPLHVYALQHLCRIPNTIRQSTRKALAHRPTEDGFMHDALVATDGTFKEPTFSQFSFHPHRTIRIRIIRTLWNTTHHFNHLTNSDTPFWVAGVAGATTHIHLSQQSKYVHLNQAVPA